MKAYRHILASAPLVAGFMLVTTGLSPCAEEKSPDNQSADKLRERIETAIHEWSSKPEEGRPAYKAMVSQVLDTLSEGEIRLVAQNLQHFDVQEEALRRWARFDPAGAVKAVRAFEDGNAAEIRLAGTGLEGGPGEAIEVYVFKLYLSAFDGWSEVAPKAAWDAFEDKEGPLSNSTVIDDYSTYFYRMIFERLAKVDPDRAFNELITHRSSDFEEMQVASMLGGYLRGTPRSRDWHKEAERLLEREWRQGWWLHSEMRTALMGRWLQDDTEAAEDWFREADVEGLSWAYRNDRKDLKIRYDLGSAGGYWAATDLPAAWNWMRFYEGFERKGFAAAVLHGANVFLSRRDSYYVDGSAAKEFLIEQAAKLPAGQDRAAWVSMIQSADATTEHLHGEPEKPRSTQVQERSATGETK